jgi:hypothetical protein
MTHFGLQVPPFGVLGHARRRVASLGSIAAIVAAPLIVATG